MCQSGRAGKIPVYFKGHQALLHHAALKGLMTPHTPAAGLSLHLQQPQQGGLGEAVLPAGIGVIRFFHSTRLCFLIGFIRMEHPDRTSL